MLIGSHDNNLYTNQDLVGETTTEVLNTIVMQLQFLDYLGNPIEPTSITTSAIERPQTILTITDEPRVVGLGNREGGGYGGNASVVNDTMQIVSVSPAGHIIESVYHFQLLELTTSEKTYSKFKFMN